MIAEAMVVSVQHLVDQRVDGPSRTQAPAGRETRIWRHFFGAAEPAYAHTTD